MTSCPIIMADDDLLVGEDPSVIELAEAAEVIYACRFGTHTQRLPESRTTWACGFAHTGRGFYHLAGGKTWADFWEAVRTPIRCERCKAIRGRAAEPLPLKCADGHVWILPGEKRAPASDDEDDPSGS